jgi:hypothetical protein
LSIRTYAYIHVTCMQYTVYTYDAATGLRQIAGTKHTLQANALIYHIDLIVTAWHRPHMANLIGTATWKHHVWRRHHSLNHLIWLQLTSAGKKVFEGMPFQFQVKSPLHTVETNLEATRGKSHMSIANAYRRHIRIKLKQFLHQLFDSIYRKVWNFEDFNCKQNLNGTDCTQLKPVSRSQVSRSWTREVAFCHLQRRNEADGFPWQLQTIFPWNYTGFWT